MLSYLLSKMSRSSSPMVDSTKPSKRAHVDVAKSLRVVLRIKADEETSCENLVIQKNVEGKDQVVFTGESQVRTSFFVH